MRQIRDRALRTAYSHLNALKTLSCVRLKLSSSAYSEFPRLKTRNNPFLDAYRLTTLGVQLTFGAQLTLLCVT